MDSFLSAFVIFFSVVERELNVPLPISKIIKKWNNLLQEYKVSKNVQHVFEKGFFSW